MTWISWTDTARKIIQSRYSRIKNRCPHVSDERILKHISRKHYPWGERANWPYQAWLKAMKGFRQKLLVPPPAHKPSEMPLFD